MKLVAIDPAAPEQEIVALCEQLLADAKSGALRAIAFGALTTGSGSLSGASYARGVPWASILGCGALAQEAALAEYHKALVESRG